MFDFSSDSIGGLLDPDTIFQIPKFRADYMKPAMAIERLLFVLSLILLLCSPVTALSSIATRDAIVSNPKNKRVAEYIFSEQMIEIMLRHGIAKDRKFGLPSCDSPYGVEPDSVDMIVPIVFAKDGVHPIKGTWSVRYRLLRCGDTKVYNTVFVASGKAGDAPSAHSYFPGDTNADTQLIRDIMPIALATAKAQAAQADCSDIDVFDMAVTEPPHQVVRDGVTYDGVWVESWRFLLCGQASDVVLHFTPDAVNGGTKVLVEPTRRQ